MAQGPMPAGAAPAASAVAPASAGLSASASAGAASSGTVSASAVAASGTRVTLKWLSVPRLQGRLTAADLGLVINTADPYSVEVGEYYARKRQLAPEQILRVTLPIKSQLTQVEAAELRERINVRFGPAIQALALAWVRPYAVDCQSINGYLAFGPEPGLCPHTCARSKASAYFNHATARPFTDLAWRPSMLIAARSVADARQLIDRGVASDSSQGLRGGLPVHAWFQSTADGARNVRAPFFPPPGVLKFRGFHVHVAEGDLPPNGPDGVAASEWAAAQEPIALLHTGRAVLPDLGGRRWMPGALADHLTSFGGVLDGSSGQTDALAWISAGATASYGTVSEPCNHPQKFPHPQVLLLHYLQGATAVESYWKSVAWPSQGVFVGEPLAAPFAARVQPGFPRGLAAP